MLILEPAASSLVKLPYMWIQILKFV